MAWFFQPKDNNCVDCSQKIDIRLERHYIVWSAQHKGYKRECADCHDTRLKTPHERRSSKDSIIHSRGRTA